MAPSKLATFYAEIIKNQLAHWASMSLDERRLSQEQVALQRGNFSKEVVFEKVSFGDVTGEWSIPKHLKSEGIAIYLHGGAYVLGNAITHRAIGSHLAEFSGCKVLVLNYHLAPEHTFPKALLDVVQTFKLLKDKNNQQKIGIIGDSAGANLSLSSTLYLRDNCLQMPDAVGLICPWNDLTMSASSHQTNAPFDLYFPNSDRLHACAKLYAGEHSLKDPWISPIFADLKGLPPMLTHIGEDEVLFDEANLVHRHALEAGVASEIEIYPHMWHVWQNFVGLMPEATDSLIKFGTFLNVHLS
jgi:acetyl esterase/lipase